MSAFNFTAKYLLVLSTLALNWSVYAQTITTKNGKYGLMDTQTGDVVLEQIYDNIFVLPFDKHISNPRNFESQSPLYALVTGNQIQLYHSTHRFLFPNTYDEIRMTEETDEKIRPYPEQYTPNHIDCILLRKGNLWGYIAHRKQYGFHDEVTKNDVYSIIEPQYQFLQFLQEQNSYDSQKYRRERRIMVAKRDSLYGALAFETGEIIVPFQYTYPIFHYGNRYNSRGFEFLSTEGGFTPYYLAGKGFDAKEHTIINANGFDVSFDVDYTYTLSFYEEKEGIHLYLFSKDLYQNTLCIYDYDIGHQLFTHTCAPGYKIISTRRNGNILMINAYNKVLRRYQVTWFNFDSRQIILFHEDKGDFLFETAFNLTQINEDFWVYFKKPSKTIGKIVGTGADLHIEWKKKVYL